MLTKTQPRPLVTLQTDLQAATAFAATGRSPNTARAYRGCWVRFEAYCASHNAQSMPASHNMVAAFLASLANVGRAFSTVQQHHAAIALAHQVARHANPCSDPLVILAMDGIARQLGMAPKRQARALLPAEARQILAAIGTTKPVDVRDRALIALWYSGGFRRSEPASLSLSDLTWHERGVIVVLRRSKTDQLGKGRPVPLASSAAETYLRPWASMVERHAVARARQPADQPLFFDLRTGAALSAGACNELVKRRAAAAGVEPITGHSFRAGLVTAAARKGVALHIIQRTTGHKSVDTVARYIRHDSLLEQIASEGLL